jgi:hypothetical protein
MKQIVSNDGILAAGHRNDNSLGISLTFRTAPVGAEHSLWERKLNTACALLDVAASKLNENEINLRGSNISAIKVVLGEEVWNVQKQGGDYIVIVSVKGHPITKSLQRLVRRGLKKIKGLSGTPAETRRFVPRIVEDEPTTKIVLPVEERSSDQIKEPSLPRVFDHLKDDKD